MNGANRSVLVNTRLGSPTGLTIDYYMDHRIYWCDSKENVVESMKPDGTDRVTVVKAGLHSFLELCCNFFLLSKCSHNCELHLEL